MASLTRFDNHVSESRKIAASLGSSFPVFEWITPLVVNSAPVDQQSDKPVEIVRQTAPAVVNPVPTLQWDDCLGDADLPLSYLLESQCFVTADAIEQDDLHLIDDTDAVAEGADAVLDWSVMVCMIYIIVIRKVV